MRLVTSRSAALRRTRRPIPSPAPIPIPSTYATLVGPTSLIPGQKHPLPPPPPPSPFPAPSTIPKPPLNAAFPTPKAQTTRESPPPRIVRPSSLSPLDIYLLSWMRLLRPDGQPTLEKLLEQMRERDHRQLDVTLEYEPTPAPDRAIGGGGDASRQPVWMADRETLVRLASEVGASSGPIASSSRQQLAEDDGIVLLAHVFPSATGQGSPRIVTSHGIALRTSGTSRLVATCAHPLSHLSGRLASPSTPDTDRVLKSILNSTSSSARVTSASLIFTPSGSVHPVTAVASCISDSDILILEVGDRLGVGQGGVEGAEAGEWKSAPVNPYPPACGTKVRAHRFAGGEKEGEGKRRWDEAEIIEYKDEMGLAAQVSRQLPTTRRVHRMLKSLVVLTARHVRRPLNLHLHLPSLARRLRRPPHRPLPLRRRPHPRFPGRLRRPPRARFRRRERKALGGL